MSTETPESSPGPKPGDLCQIESTSEGALIHHRAPCEQAGQITDVMGRQA